MIARLRTLSRSAPRPLAALLVAVLVLGLTWTLLVPAFQAPDEQSHFGYVQSVATGNGLPGKAGHQQFSTEQFDAQDLSNSDQTAANLAAKPTWARSEWKRWQRQDAGLPSSARSDGGGPGNPAASNPPLYYFYDSIPYALFSGGDFISRVTAMRIASVLWILVTVVGAWLLAGEVFRRDRLRQLVTASVAGLAPMVMFVSSQIGPDTMMYALWTLALWLGVRILRRGITPASAIGLLGLTGLAIVVKATSYALVPAALFAVGIGLWRIRDRREEAMRVGAAALGALVVPVAIWFVVARLANQAAGAQITAQGGATNVGQLLSYLWQYYLPRLPFMTPINPAGGGLPAYEIFVKQFWGAFGWLEVRFPDGFYKWFGALTVVIALAALTRVIATWRSMDRFVAVFLALVVLVLLAGLHWTDYHQFVDLHAEFMQGRYLFPLIAIAGLGVAQGLSWLRGSSRVATAGVVLGGLFVWQLAALALVATRFYA